MAERSRQLLGNPADESARLVLLGLLRATSNAARRLRSGRDEEALHDFRTSLRRTRSVLKAYRRALGRGARRFEREIRKVADSTSPGRDAEVQLAWLEARAESLPKNATPAVEALRERLQRERHAGYAHARKKSVPAFRALEKEMRRWLRPKKVRARRQGADPRSFGSFTASVLREISADLGASLNAISSPRDEVSIHRARIRGKRLRYVLEPLNHEHPAAAEELRSLKDLQQNLGDIHDRLVLVRLLKDAAPARSKKVSLTPLRAVAQSELRAIFADLRGDWLREGANALVARIEGLASDLESGRAPRPAEPHKEIERKFLLKRLPEKARRAPVKEIWQGWIPGTTLQERLRRVKQDGQLAFFRTVKLGRGIERVEIEEQAPQSVFERMWPLTEGRRVLKRRYVVEDGGRTWELDEFLDRPLFLAEVELPSAKAKVNVPAWLAKELEREVTGDDAFVNVNLAR